MDEELAPEVAKVYTEDEYYDYGMERYHDGYWEGVRSLVWSKDRIDLLVAAGDRLASLVKSVAHLPGAGGEGFEPWFDLDVREALRVWSDAREEEVKVDGDESRADN